MNKILRITLGSLGLLILILILVYIAFGSERENPSTPISPIVVGTANPYPTRTPLPSPSITPSAEQTIDPSSGTNLPQYTVPASYTNIHTPEIEPENDG